MTEQDVETLLLGFIRALIEEQEIEGLSSRSTA